MSGKGSTLEECEMRIIRKTIYLALLVTVATVGLPGTSLAQFGTNDATIRETVQRIQNRTTTLRDSVQVAANRGNAGTSAINDLTRLINDFSTATNQLDRRLSVRRATTADVRVVLDRAALIDNFFTNNRLGFGSQREWQSIRTDLDQLAQAYSITWQWSSGTTGGSEYSDYNLSDVQMRQLAQRIDTRTVTFSRVLRQDLNRRSYDNRYPVDQVRQELISYESATTQLRNRVNSRQVTSSDVRNVLDHAVYLNTFVGNQQLSYQTENNWTQLRQDLDRLASAFNIAWNWSNVPSGDYGNAELTGTYNLNSSRGDDVRRSAELATQSLPTNERQRVYDQLLRRLDPPNMLAIDQRGTAVTIASTRAPQINFVADGREHVETNQNGRTVRVRASLSGEQLTIARSGDRAEDFTVRFEPINARELLVTRTLYSDRLSQPVVVRTYYDKTSAVAQLNLYETNPESGNVGSTSGDFVIPNGTQVVAVLDKDLSTRNVSNNERFTMTVKSPGQYDGATIDGYVTSVNRSGRVTGRSEMTLNFDTIRLRDGRTYRFAGILDNVRLPNGDVVKVDNEGAVREDDSQTNRTVTRTAIGTAVGAIIGAIAGGGKGAAIGAVIGAGAGAGSVYVQGRNDLELPAGTEVVIRASGPRG